MTFYLSQFDEVLLLEIYPARELPMEGVNSTWLLNKINNPNKKLVSKEELLVAFNEILSKGFDAHHFVSGLASHFRDLLVSKNPATLSLLEVGEQAQQMFGVQAQKCDANFLNPLSFCH